MTDIDDMVHEYTHCKIDAELYGDGTWRAFVELSNDNQNWLHGAADGPDFDSAVEYAAEDALRNGANQ